MLMKIQQNGGVLIGENELLIDPSNGKNNCNNIIISHAHSDHARIKEKEKNFLMTKETFSLIKSRSEVKGKIKEIEQKKKLKFDSFELSFHSSGHILGASQVKIEGEKEVVFTSDFKLQDSILFEGAEILPSEILVIESTFGKQEFSFPEREKIYSEITSWVKECLKEKSFVVLGGYSVGKAQELTRIVNEFVGEVPLVHEKIFNANKIYEEHGVKLGNYLKLDHNLRESRILILPSQLMEQSFLSYLSLSLNKKVKAGIASGWNFYRKGVKNFPLSDHADFNQLMRYVKESNPKLVLTHHGYSKEFAHSVKLKLGINAKPLSESPQASLMEFD